MQKKDKIQICITAVLIVVLVVILAGTFGGKKRGRPTKKKGGTVSVRPSAPVSIPVPAAPAKVSLEQLKEEARNLKFRRDPFSRQAGAPTLSRGGPNLKGIVWDPQEPTAIVNERIVHIGDEMDGYRVLDIKRDAVILHDGVQEVELKLEAGE